MTAESRQQAPRARASNQQWAEMRRQQPRPTAPQSYQRPPDPSKEERSSWWPVFWLLCLILVTALMVSRQLSTPPVALSDLRQSVAAIVPFGLTERSTDSPAAEADTSTDTSEESGGWSLPNLRDRLPSFTGSFAPSATNELNNGESNTSESTIVESGSRLMLDDSFLPPLISLASSAEDDRWMMDFVSADQAILYRMRAWPSTIAWTSISWPPDLWIAENETTTAKATNFRVETTMQINPLIPQGYGGFLVRYQDEQNYYLVQFDDEGHYRTTLYQQGEWSSAKEWQNAAAINLAGQTNTIAIEDAGDLLRVYANGTLLEELTPVLPAGQTGLIAGSKIEGTKGADTKGEGIIEVDYYGLTLYELY